MANSDHQADALKYLGQHLADRRDQVIQSVLSSDSLDVSIGDFMTEEEPSFQPDESYKTGPWLVEIVPHETNSGFEKVIVCKNCMTIGRYFLNDGICQFCGSNDYERIIAQWNRTPWYKRWFTNDKGCWEAADV